MFQLPGPPAPILVFKIHSIRRADCKVSLRALCGRTDHKDCKCWVTKDMDSTRTSRLLSDLLAWGHAGRTSTALEHSESGAILKRSYGMRV